MTDEWIVTRDQGRATHSKVSSQSHFCPFMSIAGIRSTPLPNMGRFWTVANSLSLFRMVLVAPIAWLIYTGGSTGLLFALIGLAVATDWFDGRVARARGTVSDWGRVLDAAADKLAAAFVALALLLRPESAGPTLPLWFVVLILARDLLLTVGGLLQTKKLGRFTSSLWSGKVAVTALAATVLLALLRATPRVMEAMVGLTAAALVFSIVKYGIRFVAIMRHGAAALEEEEDVLKTEHRVLRAE